MLLKPMAQLLLQAGQPLGTMAQQGRHHLGDLGAGHQQAHHIAAPVHATAGGELHRQAAMEQGDPTQG